MTAWSDFLFLLVFSSSLDRWMSVADLRKRRPGIAVAGSQPNFTEHRSRGPMTTGTEILKPNEQRKIQGHHRLRAQTGLPPLDLGRLR
ncbi:hypothetical protein N658DRAFT_500512 [Parathielavia hyrcaniae]|uniref:Secreted protein n=1 Tax=Parathielavia hyrcaniae TaxID=113614 RepID=A0AAN6SXD8_9PEZI|nr:hypothetical protein N658DRAFT_500512 [Parathielavia hyrcaniae]